MLILAKDPVDFADLCESCGLVPDGCTMIIKPEEVAAFPVGSVVYVTDKAHERENYAEIIKSMKNYDFNPVAARMNPQAKALHMQVNEELAAIQKKLVYEVLENPTEGKLSNAFMETGIYLNEETGSIDVRSRVLMIPEAEEKQSNIILN